MAQMVKRLPAMRETQVRSLGQEDPLEKEMATHSSTLAWQIKKKFKHLVSSNGGFPGGQWYRILPSRRCGFDSLGQKDSLEEEMTMHCSILA